MISNIEPICKRYSSRKYKLIEHYSNVSSSSWILKSAQKQPTAEQSILCEYILTVSKNLAWSSNNKIELLEWI